MKSWNFLSSHEGGWIVCPCSKEGGRIMGTRSMEGGWIEGTWWEEGWFLGTFRLLGHLAKSEIRIVAMFAGSTGTITIPGTLPELN